MAFKNEEVHKISVGPLTGTVTLPAILTDEDLGIYVQRMRENLEKAEEESEDDYTGVITTRSSSVHHQIKHMVRAIDFPEVTIENFRNGDRPWPALTMKIFEKVKPLIDDATGPKT